MINKPSSTENVNNSELYKDLKARMAALDNFDNNVVGGMEVINQMPRVRAMMVPGKHKDLGPMITEAKRLIQNNIDRLEANSPDAQSIKKQEKEKADKERLSTIKTKLKALYEYEKNPAFGNQTLKSMPAYAERMVPGKAINMSALVAEAIKTTEQVIAQLERTINNNP
jgi:CRISPR/Cas system-associated exonuclease Cas4 (RecB family)